MKVYCSMFQTWLLTTQLNGEYSLVLAFGLITPWSEQSVISNLFGLSVGLLGHSDASFSQSIGRVSLSRTSHGQCSRLISRSIGINCWSFGQVFGVRSVRAMNLVDLVQFVLLSYNGPNNSYSVLMPSDHELQPCFFYDDFGRQMDTVRIKHD